MKFFTLAIIFFVASTVHATYFAGVSEVELAKKATFIFRGTIERTAVVFDRGTPRTSVIVNFNETVVNRESISETREIEFFVPGGVVNGNGMIIAGAPSFSRGQDIVVFAARNSDGALTVLSLSLGVYDIKEGTISNRVMGKIFPPQAGIVASPLSQSGGNYETWKTLLRKELGEQP